MAATVIDIGRWQESLKQLLPRELKDVFTGSSRRELLKNVGTAVLVFEDQVMELSTGRQAQLSELVDHSAESLAQATGKLLDLETSETSVVLLLPSDEFVATSVAMPGMARDALVSALQLQAESLLPAYSESLVVAVNPHGNDELESEIALWIAERRLDELYQAFEQQGLFLAGVIPRCLALADEVGSKQIHDQDSRSITSIKVLDGALQQWLHVSRKDLEQEIFERQWRQSLAATESDSRIEVSADNAAETYLQVNAHQPGNLHYYFIPSDALQAKRQVEKGKRVMLGLVALAAVALIAALPFLIQEFEIRRLEGNLREQQELSSTARQDRQVVQNFEQQWGVINDFPEQELVQTLFTLQSVLAPEQLTSLELSQGVVRIEGESAEPQAILQRLEQHPRFTEVAFSRATSNARYYIDLRLSTVNFEGYMVRYFPDD
ncbi:MAG: hypothetical protein KJN90_02090 [Gammaproteobacteria bacterium]|nr:hypothetical protein [Gammaproteobacteria bacterium]